MKAQELFKALGYERRETRSNITYVKPQMNEDYCEIEFDILRQLCTPRLVIHLNGQRNGYFLIQYPQLHAAIHAQMVELGWLV